MEKCIVIADDLTGANATGVQLSKLGFRTLTIMDEKKISKESIKNYDCTIYPTDSRSIPSEQAYDRVYKATKLFNTSDVRFFSKRIDSTLRGNMGSETDAMLDVLEGDVTAVVVPCFPDAKRINVGGFMLVNSVPLHLTEVALDPKSPILTPRAETLFKNQSKYKVGSIYIDEISKGKESLANRILKLKKEGVRIIIFDAISKEDIENIADGVLHSGVKFITVDPGVFTSVVAEKLIPLKKKTSSKKILMAIGSVNPVTSAQVDNFLLSEKSFNVFIDVEEFIKGESAREAEISRVVMVASQGSNLPVISVIGSGVDPLKRISFEKYTDLLNTTIDSLSEVINLSIGEIVYRILKTSDDFSSLYVTGGDIAVAVCQRLGVTGLDLIDEVVPLAAFATLIGGEYQGIKIITKGGMVGNENAIIDCVKYIEDKLN